MIINCLHLTEEDFSRLGISFTDPAYAEIFVSYTRDLLMRNIERSVLHLLRPEQRKQYSALTSFEERENWLKEHIPEFHKIVSIESEIIAWDILFSRDKLKGVIVNRDLEKEGTSIDDLEIPEHTCEFLHMYGLDTVGEIVSAGDLSYLEKAYPNKARGFRSVVLEFMLSGAQKMHDVYTDMMSVMKKYKSDSPDLILVHLRMHIQAEAVLYKQGFHSEECFYINTYPLQVAAELIRMKGITVKTVIKDKSLLEEAEKIRKETGKVKVEPWMEEFIKCEGDIAEAMDWFFDVKDSLYIPLEYYLPLSSFSDYDEEKHGVPKLLKCFDSSSEYYMFFGKCPDISLLTEEKNPKPGQYQFHFEDGTSVTFTFTEYKDNQYIGTGIIEGYMTKEDRIVIEREGEQNYFCFDWIEASRLDLMLQTVDHPIPHPKWEKHNEAASKKSAAVAEAYKKLRLQLAKDFEVN